MLTQADQMHILSIKLTPIQIARFWSYVDVREPEECWEWLKGRDNRDRYGYFWANNNGYLAHRVAWILANGNTELDVLHTCDNTVCCNVRHMYSGTDIDNQRDRRIRKPESYNHVRGERSATAKLTDAQAVELGRRYVSGESPSELAMEYGLAGGSSVNQLVRTRLGIKNVKRWSRERAANVR